jgi:hypothetical protein
MRKAFKLTGLFALVLSAMAFSATAAQAELNAKWQVNGADVTNALKAQVQVTEIETLPATGVKEGILLTKSGLTTIEVLCTAMSFTNAFLEILGAAKGSIHFSSCVTKLNKGLPAGACVPHSPGAAEGLIQTNALKGLIKLHTGGVELLELLPETGENFVTLEFGKGECSIAKAPITGKAFLKAGTATEGKENTITKLFSEGPLTSLFFGANAAVIDGSAKAALTGATHTGMTWNGKAG